MATDYFESQPKLYLVGLNGVYGSMVDSLNLILLKYENCLTVQNNLFLFVAGVFKAAAFMFTWTMTSVVTCWLLYNMYLLISGAFRCTWYIDDVYGHNTYNNCDAKFDCQSLQSVLVAGKARIALLQTMLLSMIIEEICWKAIVLTSSAWTAGYS